MNSAVGRVAHHPIEGSPYGTKDPGRGAEGRLLEGEVLARGVAVLCCFVFIIVSFEANGEMQEGESLRRVPYPTAVPRAMGRRMEAGRLLKIASGRVNWGM